MSLLSQLDVAALRLFIAVVCTGSISAGSARCNLSVAAASKRIGDMEARLGVALLRRRSRGAVPAPAGEMFCVHARQMAGTAGVMEDDLHDHAQGIEERLRVVANAASIVQFLPFDLASFLRSSRGCGSISKNTPARASSSCCRPIASTSACSMRTTRCAGCNCTATARTGWHATPQQSPASASVLSEHLTSRPAR